MTKLFISCSRTFIVSSTSKDTKIPKIPKIAGALEQLNSCKVFCFEDRMSAGDRSYDEGRKQSSHSYSNFLASDP